MTDPDHESKSVEVHIEQPPRLPGPLGWLQRFESAYGQLSFGTIVFVLLWMFVVSPELDRSRMDREEQRELVKQMTETASILKSVADTLSRTVDRLERRP